MSELEKLYAQMSELTRPKCASCMIPYSCCRKEHCYVTALEMENCGETPPPATGHPSIPYLGEHGCIIPPHQRKTCTVHVCERNYATDSEFARKYFDLRERIDMLELGLYEAHK